MQPGKTRFSAHTQLRAPGDEDYLKNAYRTNYDNAKNTTRLC